MVCRARHTHLKDLQNCTQTTTSAFKKLSFAIYRVFSCCLQRYTLKMTSKHVATTLAMVIGIGVLALTADAASAQWQWREKDGRQIFSDLAPPTEITEKNIMKRPPGVNRAAAPLVITPGLATTADTRPVVAPAAAAAKASVPKLSGKDLALEAKIRKTEKEEAAKQEVALEQVAKAKAENCERAKTGLATLQSGVRMSAVNAAGEREVFDDTRRASETKRAHTVLDASCK
jgi:hypothetical protein